MRSSARNCRCAALAVLLAAACQSRVIEGQASSGAGSSAGASTGSEQSTASSAASSVTGGATQGGRSSGTTGVATSGGTSSGATSSGASSSGATSGSTTGQPCPTGEGLFQGVCVPNEVCGPDTVWEGIPASLSTARATPEHACLTADGGRGECAAGVCLDFANDPGNCGSYGFACPSPALCVQGFCLSNSCDPRTTRHPPAISRRPVSSRRARTIPTTSAADGRLDSLGLFPRSSLRFAATAPASRGDAEDCGGVRHQLWRGIDLCRSTSGCQPAVDCASASPGSVCGLAGRRGRDLLPRYLRRSIVRHPELRLLRVMAASDAGCVDGGATSRCGFDTDCPAGTGWQFWKVPVAQLSVQATRTA